MATEGTSAPVHSTETDKMVNSIPEEKKPQEGGEGGEAETGEKRKAEDVKVIGGDDKGDDKKQKVEEVSDSKGKGKSTDPALNEEKKEEDSEDEDDEPVIQTGKRQRKKVNYADKSAWDAAGLKPGEDDDDEEDEDANPSTDDDEDVVEGDSAVIAGGDDEDDDDEEK